MPDHLHLLVQGVEQDSHLPTLCRLLRQRLAHAYAAVAGARLWQPGYFERVPREEEQTDQCANYILSNPIRASLVQSIEEYPVFGWNVVPAVACRHLAELKEDLAELKLGATFG